MPASPKPKKEKPVRRDSAAAILFVIMAFFALIGGGLAAVWRGYDTYHRERQAVLDRDAMYAHTLSRSVHIFLDNAQTTVSTLSREAEALPEVTAETLQPLVRRFAEENAASFISMYVISPEGVEIADYFPEGIDDTDRLGGIGVVLSDRAYFRDVIESRAPAVSEAVIGRSTKRPVVVVAVPMFDAVGNIIGVAAGSLDLTRLDNLALQAVGASTQMPVIVDAKGQVVVHRTRGEVAPLSALGSTEPARLVLAGNSGALPSYVDPDGREYSAAYQTVPGFNWGVWVARDAADLGAALSQAGREAAITFAAAILLGGLAYAAVAHFLFLPLRRLAKQADRIAAGDFAARTDLHGTIRSREMSELADKFAYMAQRIEDMTAKLKNDFLFRTIHDIRSPLNVVRLVTTELAKNADAPSERKYASMIDEAATRMSHLVEDLLSIAKGEQSGVQLKREAVKVADVVNVVAVSLAGDLDRRGLRFDHGATDCVVLSDVDALKEVFDNLLTNAIKYNREGGSISVSYDVGEGMANITVADTGIGIKPEAMEKLFTPYFRAAGREIQGTGLGLYIVKNLVERMGGTVTVSSRYEEGTQFVVSLPLA